MTNFVLPPPFAEYGERFPAVHDPEATSLRHQGAVEPERRVGQCGDQCFRCSSGFGRLSDTDFKESASGRPTGFSSSAWIFQVDPLFFTRLGGRGGAHLVSREIPVQSAGVHGFFRQSVQMQICPIGRPWLRWRASTKDRLFPPPIVFSRPSS